MNKKLKRDKKEIFSVLVKREYYLFQLWKKESAVSHFGKCWSLNWIGTFLHNACFCLLSAVVFEDSSLTSIFWVLTFITLVLFFAFIENVHFLFNKIPNKDRMIRIMWILGIYPVSRTSTSLMGKICLELLSLWHAMLLVSLSSRRRMVGQTLS